jgi:hypothetical protein
MSTRTVALGVACAGFVLFSMCAAFTFTEPMCRDPHCVADGGAQ